MALTANVGVIAGAAGGGVVASTWANFPAASSVPAGTVRMATDYNNSEWVSDGTYWKPRGGRQRPFVMAAAVSSSGTTSEVAVWTPTIPTGMLSPMCTIDAGFVASKTGAGTTTFRYRYNGAAGTIIGSGGAGSGTQLGFVGLLRIVASTASAGSVTLTQGMSGAGALGIGNIASAAATVSHTLATAVTINITLQSSSAADAVLIPNSYIEVCG